MQEKAETHILTSRIVLKLIPFISVKLRIAQLPTLSLAFSAIF